MKNSLCKLFNCSKYASVVRCPFAHGCWLCTRKVIFISHIVFTIYRHMPDDLFFSLSNTCCVSFLLPFSHRFCSNFGCLYKYAICVNEALTAQKNANIDNGVRYFFCFRSHCASESSSLCDQDLPFHFILFIYVIQWVLFHHFTLSLFHSFVLSTTLVRCACNDVCDERVFASRSKKFSISTLLSTYITQTTHTFSSWSPSSSSSRWNASSTHEWINKYD